jgi:hypothetical protein
MGLKKQHERDGKATEWIESVREHLQNQENLIYETDCHKYWNDMLRERRDAYVTVTLYNARGKDVFDKDEWSGDNQSIRYYEKTNPYRNIVELDAYFY